MFTPRGSQVGMSGRRSAGTTSTTRYTPRQEDRPCWSFSIPHRPFVRLRTRRDVGAHREEETSCYGCLRGYRNQPFYEEFQRGAALGFLRPLVPAGRDLVS